MGRRSIRFVVLVTVAALVASMAAPAFGVVARGGDEGAVKQRGSDKKAHPLGDKKAALRANALKDKASGMATGDVYEVAPGQFAELTLEDTGMVWTVPGEFSDLSHNSILEPDRTVDNSTIWTEDFGTEYYNTMLYARGTDVNSVAEYFLEQSSGRYTIDGECEDWVAVPGDHTVYDDGDGTPDTSENVWLFLDDSLDGWYAKQIASGMSSAEVDAYLARYDTYDRYDWDGDGVFAESDGYIDHFQSLHAGEGEEAGGGVLGDEAIWSHSWYAYYGLIGKVGPSPEYLLGGVQIGSSSYWVGDYTIQPENGGVGVFAHEYTHDLGLPDLYDTAGGDNATSFWTLMDSGSWLSQVDYDLGSAPDHLGAWEKLQLGWLNYATAVPGATGTVVIGPAEYNSSQAQALRVDLPDKNVEWDIAAPYAGTYFYYSDKGDNLRNEMTKALTLEAGASLDAMVNYGIEEGYDYAALRVSTDGGSTWDTVPTSLSNSSVEPNGIDGFSGGWVPMTADLSAYVGDVVLGFQYVTDGGVAEVGFMADDIAITGQAFDGAEVAAGWAFEGFKVSTGHEGGMYENYYLAEYRQYWGYDVALLKAYNWGFLKGKDAKVNWAERFPYQDGLLVWYCDSSQPDNNTSVHPGYGFALPVDAHAKALRIGKTKTLWRNRIQTYDSTFGLEATDSLPLHYNGKLYPVPSLPGVATFNDALLYWDATNPTGSVITPVTGTTVTVLRTSAAPDGGKYMTVRVTAP
ncbi:MAG: immune inhibitor A [Coriobacteriia bacterium]|nr:immune inhibitor A [Coriobacteriia bacterium]